MMAEYEGMGPRDDEYTEYHSIPFMEKNVENI
jgi:hypothetical protein